MHISEWLRDEGLNYAQGGRRLGFDRTTTRRYALGLEIPRAERIAEIRLRTDNKVTAADWYPEDNHVNGVSA